jgi:hypothetical protein
VSDEFCLLHGYEYMERDPKRGPVSWYCAECERTSDVKGSISSEAFVRQLRDEWDD